MSSKDTRELLVKAAIHLFAHKGYFDTSIRDIGAKAGVSNSIVYHYFTSKEDLLFEILKTPSNELLQTLIEIEQKVPDPLECLRQMLVAHTILFTLKRKYESRIMASESYWLRGKKRQVVKQIQRDIYDIYMRKLRQLDEAGLIKDVDLTVMGFSIFGIINSFYDWYHDGGRLTMEEVGQNLVKIIFNSILKNNIDKNI